MSKNKSKSLAYAAILLAICIVSQFLKNTSVYITGPIINVCLVLCVLTAGIRYAVALSVITPITSFIITGSPIMAAIPMIIPCVIVGNLIYVICIFLLKEKPNKKVGFPISLTVGTILKAAFMGVVISLIIVPAFLPDKMSAMLTTIQMTFSFTQLITAAIGSVLAYILFIPISKSIKI